ncbi:response regulator transcription factor [Nitratiruptor tergarcus]|uniref:DNA-binding response regulator, OmpR family, contains REC and winged-helix (WHTH) domain n=1 Tax=Nitratiruptor tergarcus DSM 16512 TaxID=1069081 RepID=A0A1W1WS55_9BACT|nr:response regulator transcription factor [Nitratiruptor tergarcus]SMC09148.1 DNA-binding response regulator, OmpR family, contains REC and winged-helix (wHTH) domain [Nitratiruptor tergarcus DSM 16512]
MAYRVLLLEDDELFGETVEEFLQEEGYRVDWAVNAKEALEFCYHTKYDLYLFDVKLEGMDGFTLLEELRKSGDETPAIFITSKNQKEDIKEGFLRGADDYMTKPVDLDELSLRIKALLRRSYGAEKIAIDQYVFDIKQMKLQKGDEVIELNPKEMKLLELFVKNRKKIVTKERIYEYLWKPDEVVSDGALRVYVNTLKKIFGKDAITNVRGVGYKFEK